MPIIQIPFDLPFDYCKNCAALDPKAEAWFANHVPHSVHFYCQNAGLCTTAEKARRTAKQEADSPICESCEYCIGITGNVAMCKKCDGKITGINSCGAYKKRRTP